MRELWRSSGHSHDITRSASAERGFIMKHALTIRVLFMTGIMLGLVIVMTTVGMNTTPAGAHSVTTFLKRDAASGSVTVLVLDMSGSMGQNDPQGLRCSAANAFIDLSGPGSHIGVIGLNNKNG